MAKVIINFLSVLIIISCSSDSTSPFIYDNETLEIIYFKRENQILQFSYSDKAETLIYDAGNKSISSFDYLEKNNSIYLILFEDLDTNYTYQTTVAKLNEKGDLIEIFKNTTHEGEGFSSLLEINVSDDEKYIAFTGTYYEGQFFVVYDINNDEFIQFSGSQYTEYVSFLTWGSTNETIYVQSHEYLVLYNIEDKTISMLDSPNIRDYLSEEYLLSKGYLGDRYDYNKNLKIKYPQFINWKETGHKFVYMSNDSMYLFDLENKDSEYLFYIGNYRRYYKNIDILWNNSGNQKFPSPFFNDNDIIVSFDSTSLQSIPTLNDSLFRYVGKSYSISTIRPNWNNRHGWDKYYFRREITAEKIHIAEFDFHMWYYALRLTPPYWFLVVNLDDEDFDSDDFINRFNQYNEDYSNDYQYFKELNYPKPIRHKKIEYNKRHYVDLEFQKLFLNFFINQDTSAFKNKTFILFNIFDSGELNETFMLLDDPNIEENRRMIKFYQSIHNNFLNFYGSLIYYDIENIKEELFIEELPPDSFTKIGELYTLDYHKFKKYDYK